MINDESINQEIKQKKETKEQTSFTENPRYIFVHIILLLFVLMLNLTSSSHGIISTVVLLIVIGAILLLGYKFVDRLIAEIKSN